MVAKWRGREHAKPGGLGGAVLRRGDLVVAALVAVNAVGDIDDGRIPAAVVDGSFDEWPREVDVPFTNTTIGVVITNARLDKIGCRLVAESGHDGLGRALYPAHTRFDGDALVAAATGLVDAPLEAVRVLAVSAVESAVRSVA
jgi:L-aminopeptidase/D-esterase-like protein